MIPNYFLSYKFPTLIDLAKYLKNILFRKEKN